MKLFIFIITPFVCFASKEYKVVYNGGWGSHRIHNDTLSITEYDTSTKVTKTFQLSFKRKGNFLDKDSIETRESALKLRKFLDDNDIQSPLTGLSGYDRELIKRFPLAGMLKSPYKLLESSFLAHGYVKTSYKVHIDMKHYTETASFSKSQIR